MSPEMKAFFELLVAAEAAHKAGRLAEFDLLMAEAEDAYEHLSASDRWWIDTESDKAVS
jgi:hypothetical protein